jgi:hypothetical protein
MRNATIEAEVREEAAQEMQEALKQMHTDFAKLFQEQVSLLSATRTTIADVSGGSIREQDGS